MNNYIKYAKQYGCTIAQAIADRDYPMDESQCVKAFIEATGHKPTKEEIKEMQPDSLQAIRQESVLQDWEDFDMGRR